jgi:mitogen-activated protein kinase kinase kinase 4
MRSSRGRLARSRADRRNTLDCAILNQMIIEPSIDDKTTRSDKRSIQLQRDFERDQKMAVAMNVHRPVVQRCSLNLNSDDANTSDCNQMVPSAEPKCIESASRFMSVTSRPVGCRISAPPSAFSAVGFPKIATSENVPQTRREFHETFSNLIKLGSNEKQERNTKSVIISKEEQLWQTEVKDMIWLELQANMQDRTLEQQDKYLFAARQNIGELLREIMCYRFNRKLFRVDSAVSTKTVDSGLSSMASSTDAMSNSE